MKSDVTIIEASYDETSSFRKGADKGPKAILKCLDEQIEVLERFTKTEPVKDLDIERRDMGDMSELSPEEMVDKVSEEFTKASDSSKFTILIGGEHSISAGAFKSMSKKDPEDITILQIDAHPDLRNDDSDYSIPPHGKYAHSCVMRRAHEMGFKIVQLGIRAYSKEEYEFAKENKIKFFEWGAGNHPSADDVVHSIKTKNVYITLDVDGIDPAHMPATGTPVQGGLEWYYTLNVLQKVFEKKNVVGADIVEVSPRPDDVLTEYGAAQILYNMMAYKSAKK